MQSRKLLNKRDLLLILVLLILAAGIWIGITVFSAPQEESHVYAEIHFGHNLIKTVPLHIDRTFSAGPNPNVVFEIRNNEISFSKSDCPDQVCVNTGFISRHWEFAACLPNLLLLTIQISED